MTTTSTSIGLLKFTPCLRTVRWGGERIAAFKGVPASLPRVGESWEVSALPGMLTTVNGGPHHGKTLPQLLAEAGEQLMGRRLLERYGQRFPLLIKFIDATDDLSIQVHPHDDMVPGGGKTELWYIIDSRPGAKIYSGLNRRVTPAEMRARIDDGTLTDVLACHRPLNGDVFYLPAGRVHSIGAGNLLLEIQQASDITYRLWDYNRRDVDGSLRPLHIDQALKAIDYDQTDYGLARPELLDGRETLVKRTPYFTVTALCVDDQATVNTGACDSPRIIVAVGGQGSITAPDGQTLPLTRGETVVVPADMPSVTLNGNAQDPLRLITAYIE